MGCTTSKNLPKKDVVTRQDEACSNERNARHFLWQQSLVKQQKKKMQTRAPLDIEDGIFLSQATAKVITTVEAFEDSDVNNRQGKIGLRAEDIKLHQNGLPEFPPYCSGRVRVDGSKHGVLEVKKGRGDSTTGSNSNSSNTNNANNNRNTIRARRNSIDVLYSQQQIEDELHAEVEKTGIADSYFIDGRSAWERWSGVDLAKLRTRVALEQGFVLASSAHILAKGYGDNHDSLYSKVLPSQDVCDVMTPQLQAEGVEDGDFVGSKWDKSVHGAHLLIPRGVFTQDRKVWSRNRSNSDAMLYEPGITPLQQTVTSPEVYTLMEAMVMERGKLLSEKSQEHMVSQLKQQQVYEKEHHCVILDGDSEEIKVEKRKLQLGGPLYTKDDMSNNMKNIGIERVALVNKHCLQIGATTVLDEDMLRMAEGGSKVMYSGKNMTHAYHLNSISRGYNDGTYIGTDEADGVDVDALMERHHMELHASLDEEGMSLYGKRMEQEYFNTSYRMNSNNNMNNKSILSRNVMYSPFSKKTVARQDNSNSSNIGGYVFNDEDFDDMDTSNDVLGRNGHNIDKTVVMTPEEQNQMYNNTSNTNNNSSTKSNGKNNGNNTGNTNNNTTSNTLDNVSQHGNNVNTSIVYNIHGVPITNHNESSSSTYYTAQELPSTSPVISPKSVHVIPVSQVQQQQSNAAAMMERPPSPVDSVDSISNNNQPSGVLPDYRTALRDRFVVDDKTMRRNFRRLNDDGQIERATSLARAARRASIANSDEEDEPVSAATALSHQNSSQRHATSNTNTHNTGEEYLDNSWLFQPATSTATSDQEEHSRHARRFAGLSFDGPNAKILLTPRTGKKEGSNNKPEEATKTETKSKQRKVVAVTPIKQVDSYTNASTPQNAHDHETSLGRNSNPKVPYQAVSRFNGSTTPNSREMSRRDSHDMSRDTSRDGSRRDISRSISRSTVNTPDSRSISRGSIRSQQGPRSTNSSRNGTPSIYRINALNHSDARSDWLHGGFFYDDQGYTKPTDVSTANTSTFNVKYQGVDLMDESFDPRNTSTASSRPGSERRFSTIAQPSGGKGRGGVAVAGQALIVRLHDDDDENQALSPTENTSKVNLEGKYFVPNSLPANPAFRERKHTSSANNSFSYK